MSNEEQVRVVTINQRLGTRATLEKLMKNMKQLQTICKQVNLTKKPEQGFIQNLTEIKKVLCTRCKVPNCLLVSVKPMMEEMLNS